MSDQDGHITVINIFVHDHRVSSVCHAEVYQMVIVFAVMVDDLVGVPELMEQFFPEDIADLLLRILPVQTVGADKKDVFLLHSGGIQFF